MPREDKVLLVCPSLAARLLLADEKDAEAREKACLARASSRASQVHLTTPRFESFFMLLLFSSPPPPCN